MGKLDWMKKIEIEDILEGDAKIIRKKCGLEVLISLWENLPSIFIYLSVKPVRKAQERYIKQFYNGNNVRELAIDLGVSMQFVYKIVTASHYGKRAKKESPLKREK